MVVEKEHRSSRGAKTSRVRKWQELAEVDVKAKDMLHVGQAGGNSGQLGS